MSLDDITHSSTTTYDSAPVARKRSLTWLLPLGLLAGFLLVLYLLFGDRLHPSISVEAASVITIRSDNTGASLASSEGNSNEAKQKMLFQASGWIEPAPYITFVPTLIDGIVDKVHVLEGQTVKQGDLLATLIDEDAKLNVKTIVKKQNSLQKTITAHCTNFEVLNADVAMIEKAIIAQKALVNDAKDNFDRLSKLSKGVVPQQQIIQAQSEVKRQSALLAEVQAKLPKIASQQLRLDAEKNAMEAQLEELAVDLEKTQLALSRTKIHSPMDGIVLHLHASPGKRRMLSMDAPKSATIVELYDPKKLQARIDVALNEAAAIQVGQKVELSCDLLNNQTFEGVVTRIEGQADLQRNTLQAKVSLETTDSRLRPEMLVRGKFFAVTDPNQSGNQSASSGRLSLYIPEKSIINESQVWVISDDSTAELKTITLGDQVRDDHRLVTEGLNSGELVILPPHTELKSGIRVTTNLTTK